MQTEKKDIYAEITNVIIAELEKGVRPWQKPWQSSATPLRPLRAGGEPYRGVNVLLLWMATERYGHTSPYWLTFRQAKELGGHVRKGEKSTPVVYATTYTKTEQNEQGEDEEKDISFLKAYPVFNLTQTEGLQEKFPMPEGRKVQPRDNAPIPHFERFAANTGADVRRGANSAYYSPLEDCIHMPELARFDDSHAFYSALGHELIHWTNRTGRSPRLYKPTTHGTANYAREELVAELGAAFLCADLGLAPTPRPDHAEYLANWLEVLREDKRAIFKAAAMAQKAADYLHSLQHREPATGDAPTRKVA